MRELGALREGRDAIEAEETRLLRSMMVQESIRQWFGLRPKRRNGLSHTLYHSSFVPRPSTFVTHRCASKLPFCWLDAIIISVGARSSVG